MTQFASNKNITLAKIISPQEGNVITALLSNIGQIEPT